MGVTNAGWIGVGSTRISEAYCITHWLFQWKAIFWISFSVSFTVFFPPSFCTSHSIVSWSTRLTLFKCNINQKANYSNFLTMTTWSLGQCPKPKCLASGSTLHAAPPVRCWAAHSICIYLLSIYPIYPLLETWAWWMVIQFSLDCTNFTAQSKRRGERPRDLRKLLPQGHQVLHLPELLHFHPLWPHSDPHIAPDGQTCFDSLLRSSSKPVRVATILHPKVFSKLKLFHKSAQWVCKAELWTKSTPQCNDEASPKHFDFEILWPFKSPIGKGAEVGTSAYA